jgi:choline dehydrogenase-like flavoprotein
MNRDKVDAVVIGSGAGGSVMAYHLARRGLRVAVLERGRRWDPTAFQHSELWTFPRLYKNGGLQTTTDNDIVIGQGCAVGGSTVINNAIWLRCDLDRVLPEWERHGAAVDRHALVAGYEELERHLHVSLLPEPLAKKSAVFLWRAPQRLGIHAEYLHNNRDSCIGCGWCNYGCQYNRKTSMLVTYIPWAESLGARVYDECADVRVTLSGRRAVGATYTRHGVPGAIAAERVVVCAGAIGSSAVLLQSGITLGGRVGRGLHLLGGVFVAAETTDVLDGYDGIGLCCVAHAGSDYVIESYFAPPGVFAIGLGGWFGTHFQRMRNYTRYAQAGVMVGTEPTGRVSLDKHGEPQINIALSATDLGRLKRGVVRLAEIFLAGGAHRILPATFRVVEFANRSDLELIDEYVRAQNDLLVGSAHPQGGNPMSASPERGVVGEDFQVHGLENLFVADASVFPTNIWANCQATVMAMSHYASGFVSR